MKCAWCDSDVWMLQKVSLIHLPNGAVVAFCCEECADSAVKLLMRLRRDEPPPPLLKVLAEIRAAAGRHFLGDRSCIDAHADDCAREIIALCNTPIAEADEAVALEAIIRERDEAKEDAKCWRASWKIAVRVGEAARAELANLAVLKEDQDASK